MLQRAAVRCSALQCFTCSVFQCVAVCCSPNGKSTVEGESVCCSVLRCAAACCSVLQCAAVCCSVLQCVAVYAVCCSPNSKHDQST